MEQSSGNRIYDLRSRFAEGGRIPRSLCAFLYRARCRRTDRGFSFPGSFCADVSLKSDRIHRVFGESSIPKVWTENVNIKPTRGARFRIRPHDPYPDVRAWVKAEVYDRFELKAAWNWRDLRVRATSVPSRHWTSSQAWTNQAKGENITAKLRTGRYQFELWRERLRHREVLFYINLKRGTGRIRLRCSSLTSGRATHHGFTVLDKRR